MLIEALKSISAFAVADPRTAFKFAALPADIFPVLLLIEKLVLVFASPPHVCPSEAVPQNV